MALNQNEATLPKTPFSRTAVATAAETAFHNPTNAVTLLAAADNTDGARVTRLYALARANPTAIQNCQLYKLVGSTYTLIDSVTMANTTPSATVASPKADFGYSLSNPLELFAGEGLAVAIGAGVTNGIVFRCEGGFYAV